MKTLIFVVLLAGLALFSSARTWALVSDGPNVDVYLDTSSIQPDGPYMRAWFRAKYDNVQIDGVTGRPFLAFRQMLLVDCRTHRYAVKEMALFTRVGETVPVRSAVSDDAELAFQPLSGALGSAISEQTCLRT